MNLTFTWVQQKRLILFQIMFCSRVFYCCKQTLKRLLLPPIHPGLDFFGPLSLQIFIKPNFCFPWSILLKTISFDLKRLFVLSSLYEYKIIGRNTSNRDMIKFPQPISSTNHCNFILTFSNLLK